MECYIYKVERVMLKNITIGKKEDALMGLYSFTLVQTPKVLSKKIRLTIMKSDLKRYV